VGLKNQLNEIDHSLIILKIFFPCLSLTVGVNIVNSTQIVTSNLLVQTSSHTSQYLLLSSIYFNTSLLPQHPASYSIIILTIRYFWCRCFTAISIIQLVTLLVRSFVLILKLVRVL